MGRMQDHLAHRHYERLSCRWSQHPLSLVSEAGMQLVHVHCSALGISCAIEGQPGEYMGR